MSFYPGSPSAVDDAEGAEQLWQDAAVLCSGPMLGSKLQQFWWKHRYAWWRVKEMARDLIAASLSRIGCSRVCKFGTSFPFHQFGRRN
jgi:hypothetical protein